MNQIQDWVEVELGLSPNFKMSNLLIPLNGFMIEIAKRIKTMIKGVNYGNVN